MSPQIIQEELFETHRKIVRGRRRETTAGWVDVLKQ